MAIDLAGFITYLKDHAVEHGFHVHDERHFIETYSLRQAWEVDVHPESACDGPLDLHISFDVEPRILLNLEEQVSTMDEEYRDPDGDFRIPLLFNWALPALEDPPDLVLLATELAGVGGMDLPIEVSGVESTGALATVSDVRLSLVGKVEVSLIDVMLGREQMCETLDRCREISEWLIDHASDWKIRYPDAT